MTAHLHAQHIELRLHPQNCCLKVLVPLLPKHIVFTCILYKLYKSDLIDETIKDSITQQFPAVIFVLR